MIKDLTLLAGLTTLDQSLPVDPSGIVYNSITREPVEGAIARIYSGGVLLDTTCVSAAQQNRVTGVTGFYRFDLLPGCAFLGGDFDIEITPPTGFYPTFPSTIIPAGCESVCSA